MRSDNEEAIRSHNFAQETKINWRVVDSQPDLFFNKKNHLANWMKFKKFFATHDIIEFGLKIFYIRCDRTKRDFLEKGLIRKLTELEKRAKGWNCRDAVYEWIR